jgi:radical SAM superfamily enzyme YgiQ (UPF0313 family)
MKILLIEPAKSPVSIGGEDVFIYEPLALEYVAAGVAGDHEVKILDMRMEKDLQGILDAYRPDVVGITSYTVHVNGVRKLFEDVKAWNPDVLTVVGGHHATVSPEDFLTPSIDLIVMGEGAAVFREIVEKFERGERCEETPGIACKNGDQLVRRDPILVTDLDRFPLPARKLTERYRNHYYAEWMKPLASIRTSKGCPHRCNFCVLWKITGGRYLRRKPEMVVRELAGIDEEFVFFADDESLIDVKRMKTLAQLIRTEGIRKRYFLYGRSDTIARHPELLEAWKEIGLDRVFVGFEFFRDSDLSYIKKGSTTGENEKAVRILQDLDIDIYASFIVRPEFTRDDFKDFRQYCLGLNLNYASFAVLTPLPGTDLYEEVKDYLITHDYDYFDFIHTLIPPTLPMDEFYEEYYQLYRKSISPSNQLSLLRKFPWRELPSTLVKSYRWYRRLRTAHLDYGNGGDPGGES